MLIVVIVHVSTSQLLKYKTGNNFGLLPLLVVGVAIP